MKAPYETPVVEKLEFDYSSVVTASGSGHGDVGMGVSQTDKGCDGQNLHPTHNHGQGC